MLRDVGATKMPAVVRRLPRSARIGEGGPRTDRWMAWCATGRGTARTAGKLQGV
jgi:hypothetical protein